MLNINNINKYRKLQNISYEELAKLVGYKTPAGFRNALKNNRLDLEKISKLADILNVEIGYIYEDEAIKTLNEPTPKYGTDNDIINVLLDEIKILTEQIKQKDNMINKLLEIINHNKK